METGREMGRWVFRTIQTFFPGVFLAAGVVLCLLAGCEEAEPEESFGACEEPVAMPVTEDESIAADPFELESLSEIERSGLCLLVEDFDGDHHLDIFTVDLSLDNALTNRVVFYWGNGDGTFVHESMEIEMKPNGACTYGDVNGDGRFDLMVTGKITNINQAWFLMATGPRTYDMVSDRLTFPESFSNQPVRVATLMDLDPAPGPELLLGTSALHFPCLIYNGKPCAIFTHADFGFFRQNTDGIYQHTPEALPPSLAQWDEGPFVALQGADLNHDGLAEIFVGSDIGADLLVSEKANGGLFDFSSGSGLPTNNHAMGMTLGDFNGDGRLDLFTSDLTRNRLLLGESCGGFVDASESSNIISHSERANSWGAISLDVELDGDLDLFVTHSDIWPEGWEEEYELRALGRAPQEWSEYQHHTLLTNDGDARFDKIDLPHLEGTFKSWFSFTVAKGDLDEDGDEDLILTEYGTLAMGLDPEANVDTNTMILWNRAEQVGNWISVIPLTNDLPAHGARVTVVEAGGARHQDLYRAGGTGGHAPIRAHFGLGTTDAPIQILVDWPDGTTSMHEDVAVNQILVIQQP